MIITRTRHGYYHFKNTLKGLVIKTHCKDEREANWLLSECFPYAAALKWGDTDVLKRLRAVIEKGRDYNPSSAFPNAIASLAANRYYEQNPLNYEGVCNTFDLTDPQRKIVKRLYQEWGLPL